MAFELPLSFVFCYISDKPCIFLCSHLIDISIQTVTWDNIWYFKCNFSKLGAFSVNYKHRGPNNKDVKNGRD